MPKIQDPSKLREEPKACPICGLMISRSWNFTVHMRRHNNVKPFKCNQCSASYILNCELKTHMLTHLPEGIFKCPICLKSFKSPSGLRIHKISHGIGGINCRDCGAKFRTPGQKKKHMVNCVRQNFLQCSHCIKTFSQLRFKIEHELVAHGKKIKEKKTRSEKPKLKFSSRKPKMRIINSQNWLSCQYCPERFRYKPEQRSHYETKHKEHFDKVFRKCEFCGMVLTKTIYPEHIKAHKGIFAHKCTLCDYKSVRSCDLRKHISNVHAKVRPFKCSTCGKMFNQRLAAESCEKRHLGIKDIECRFCPTRFYDKNTMFHHTKRHHSEHKCKVCKFIATDLTVFRKHLKCHEKESPDLAGLSASTDANKSRMCEKCGKFFRTSCGLTRHVKRMHIDDIETKSKCKKDKKLNTNNLKKCSFCDYKAKASSHENFLQHYKEHHPLHVLKCELCSYTTIHNPHLVRHLKSHSFTSAGETYICRVSEKEFQLEVDMDLSIYECAICGYSKIDEKHMEHHAQEHSMCCDEDSNIIQNAKIKVEKLENSSDDEILNGETYGLKNEYANKTEHSANIKQEYFVDIGLLPASESPCEVDLKTHDALTLHMNSDSDKSSNNVPKLRHSTLTLPTKKNRRKSKPFKSEATKHENTLNTEINAPAMESTGTCEDTCQTLNFVERDNCLETSSSEPHCGLKEKIKTFKGQQFFSLNDLKALDSVTLANLIKKLQ